MHSPEEIDFKEVLRALLDEETPFPPRLLNRLSDLEKSELQSLSDIWQEIPLWRRQALMEDIEALSKTDMMVSFEALGMFSVQDQDKVVRLHAVRTLAEFENAKLIPVYKKLLLEDPDGGVRSASAGALGRYIYLGEIDELAASKLREIEELLLKVTQGNDPAAIRRSALESLGYSSREEVDPLIKAAYNSGDMDWIVSAICAMGRSGNEIWEKPVLKMLSNTHPSLRGEAARAAGELELSEAVPLLIELLDDPSDTIRFASIWSLSQIGGEGIRDLLERLYEEAENDDEIDQLESAMDNLAFTEGLPLMPLFDLPEDEEENDLEEDSDDEFEGIIFDEDEEEQED
jgi:HEAT repeat protein